MFTRRPRLRRCKVIRPYSSVTTRAPEDDPKSAGLDPEVPDRIWKQVERLYATGVQPGIQLCIRRRGQVILHRAIGHAHGNGPDDKKNPSRTLLTPATPICIFSASKAITAMLIHHLDDEGLLHVDDRVAHYIPEFAQQGKEWITLRHVLTHRAGISVVPSEYNKPELLGEQDLILRLLCEAEPSSRAGGRLAYHALTGGFILGAIIERVTGKPIRQVLDEVVRTPLGLKDFDYGIAPERLDEVATNYYTGPNAPWPISRVPHQSLGMSFRKATELSNSPAYLTGVVPSGNIIGTADEACRFFEMMRNGGELDGHRVFSKRTVDRAITETAFLEMDFSLLLPIRYGSGLMLGGKGLSPFGPNTRRAYGHLGFINIMVWADPQRELSAALMTTGKPFISRHLLPLWGLLSAISKGIPTT